MANTARGVNEAWGGEGVNMQFDKLHSINTLQYNVSLVYVKALLVLLTFVRRENEKHVGRTDAPNESAAEAET